MADSKTGADSSAQVESFQYDDDIVRKFTLATLLWAFVAMLAGIYVALELANHNLNLSLPWFSFGRLRPLHTNAAIFAFAGNAIFAGIYYSMQRLLKTRLWSDTISRFHFWGWQTIIVSAALTLPFGITQGKEYAELEWPIDIMIAVVWVAFGLNMLQTIRVRREKHIYVAIWFYIATFVTVAVLHVVNSIAIPVSFLKSYDIYAGVTDALVQWWYGHNAVAFFLTTPFLGLMYYFIPKSVNRPVYSYRLSVIHFWTLVFIYIWAGPHHLLNTALPDWAQTAGMVFSVMLWIPSWGGMINGILTLRGAWDKLRTDPPTKFLIAATTFYGMSTFEGPLLSIKSVSALGHYTDWIIAHVHGGALGWNGLLAFGMIYYLVPRLWKTKPLNVSWMNIHFWTATVGILVYMISMYASGITQGLMWMGLDDKGHMLYPDFVQTVTRIVPLYWVRALGGVIYLGGFVLMIVNVYQAIKSANPEYKKEVTDRYPRFRPLSQGLFAPGFTHERLEAMPMTLAAIALVGILIGTAVELIPFVTANSYKTELYQGAKVKHYTALEQAGRDIYVREGCYLCHSQMIRQLDFDVVRYGAPSRVEESMYDHPFQWGSKRIGPDLARVGGKYPNLWHYRHMNNPREVVSQSIMPSYPWLLADKTDYESLPKKLSVLKTLGVPYDDNEVSHAVELAQAQAKTIADDLRQNGASLVDENREIVALIAYLQLLGKQAEPEQKVGAK